MAATTGGAGTVTVEAGLKDSGMEVDATVSAMEHQPGIDGIEAAGDARQPDGKVDLCADEHGQPEECAHEPEEDVLEERRVLCPEAARSASGAAGAALRQRRELEERASAGSCAVLGGRHRLAKEFWCIREPAVFPKACDAAVAAKEAVMDAWGSYSQLKGFPVEVLVYNKVNNLELPPAPTGMVKVTRAANDGWEALGMNQLARNAWPLSSNLDQCKWIKSFGSSTEHAKEINWLMNTLHNYLAAGLLISMDPRQVSFCYTELPPRVARINGSEWSGYIFGVNLDMRDLIEVVEWGAARDKETKSTLATEFVVDPNRKGVVSKSISAGNPGHRFQPADFIAGSFTLLIESKLGLLDFDMEASAEPAGVEILCEMFGEHVIQDVTPSVGGLVGTRIVRVKVRCGLRHEKEARAHAQALVLASSEENYTFDFMVGDMEVNMCFLSEEAARAAAELVESKSSTRNAARGGSQTASDLAAVTVALNEIKGIQAKSALQIAALADDQKTAVESCSARFEQLASGTAAKLEGLASLHEQATAESQAKFEATQAQLAELAAVQAQAAKDNKDRMAEVADAQKQAFIFAQTMHLQLTESLSNLAAISMSSKPKIQKKALQATIENVENVFTERFVLALPRRGWGKASRPRQSGSSVVLTLASDGSSPFLAGLAQDAALSYTRPVCDVQRPLRWEDAPRCAPRGAGCLSRVAGSEVDSSAEQGWAVAVLLCLHAGRSFESVCIAGCDVISRWGGVSWSAFALACLALLFGFGVCRTTLLSTGICPVGGSRATQGRGRMESRSSGRSYAHCGCSWLVVGVAVLSLCVCSCSVASSSPSFELANRGVKLQPDGSSEAHTALKLWFRRLPSEYESSGRWLISQATTSEDRRGGSAEECSAVGPSRDAQYDSEVVRSLRARTGNPCVEETRSSATRRRGCSRFGSLCVHPVRSKCGGQGQDVAGVVEAAGAVSALGLPRQIDRVSYAQSLGILATRQCQPQKRWAEAGKRRVSKAELSSTLAVCAVRGGQVSITSEWCSPGSHPAAWRSHSEGLDHWVIPDVGRVPRSAARLTVRGCSFAAVGGKIAPGAPSSVSGTPSRCSGRCGRSGCSVVPSATCRGGSLHRGGVCCCLEKSSWMYSHCQQGVCYCADTALRPVQCAAGGSVECAGLGNSAWRASFGGAYPQGSRHGVRLARALNHGPGCSLQGGSVLPSPHLPVSRLQGWSHVGADTFLCVHLLGHRCRGGCDGGVVPGWLAVPSCCRGRRDGENGVAACVARQAGDLLLRRLWCRGQNCLVAYAGLPGRTLHELALRAMVNCEHDSHTVTAEEGLAGACGRGGSRTSEGCPPGAAAGRSHRMRRRLTVAPLSCVLALDLWILASPVGMGLVFAGVRPCDSLGRIVAKEAAMGSRHQEALAVAGLYILLLVCVKRWASRVRFGVKDGRLGKRALVLGPKCVGRRRQTSPCFRRCGFSRAASGGSQSGTAGGVAGGSGQAGSSGQKCSSHPSPGASGRQQDDSGDGEKAAGGPAHKGGSSTDAHRPVLRQELGKCLFWNMRQLCMPTSRDLSGEKAVESSKGSSVRSAALRKLRFLMDLMDEHAPWIVALVEVDDSFGRMRALRAWFRRRGFEMVHLPGEGSSRGGGSAANGIVVAVSKEVQVIESCRVAFRALAITAYHKECKQRICVTVMHGSSTEGGEEDFFGEGGWAFSSQLEAAASWCEAHEGALLMDANRVPCAQWRCPPSPRLSKGDLAIKRLAGWSCSCCARGEEIAPSGVSLIGPQLEQSGSAVWTRWGTSQGLLSSCARLDFGLAFGRSRTTWTDAKAVRPSSATSDHAAIIYSLMVSSASGPAAETRPMPISLGRKPRADRGGDQTNAWGIMHRLSCEEDFVEQMRLSAAAAVKGGSSVVEPVVRLFRDLGERAVEEASRHRDRLGIPHRSAGPESFDNASDRKVWEQRINVAQQIRDGRRDMMFKDWQLLFHPKSGMGKFCRKFSHVAGRRVNWRCYIRRCRRQWDRAVWFLERRNREKDEKLASLCHRLEKTGNCLDSPAHISRLWGMIRERGGADKVQRLYEGDVKGARVIDAQEDDFLEEAGNIGERFVRSMDRGFCPEALQAWLEIFVPRGRPCSEQPGDWDIGANFPFYRFLKILKSMRGKAVGAGGFSVELALAAGREAQWLLYQALLADAQSGHFASNWRRVLYVLLRKPAPNDPDVISQRREIALMPQDLKVLLQGLRWSSYSKLSEDLDPAQYGWRPGYGCADPGLALSVVLQQARRLRHPVFVLYIDLANFFPAINRAAARTCEAWAGLPTRVADVVKEVYGSELDPEHAVRCQYETEVGLGHEFRNHVGRLMGCPLSPDSAKILLNTVITAIRRSITGVALWPFAGAEITQVAYADDWVGVFDDAEQLRKTWDLWSTWAGMIGAKLGIKGFLKTVVSGTTWEHGKAAAIRDPLLRDLDGSKVPMLAPDKLYKHLGVPRACCADDQLSWTGGGGVTGIRDKLRACVFRLRKLRRHGTSDEQFMCISNVLLGGMAGAFLQSASVSFEETEEVERMWRRAYCRFAKRDFSAPSQELYAPGGDWGMGRTHLYCIGAAALYAAVEKAMADNCASPARDAVRSAIALAMFSWGCRSSPNRWSWDHLESELRSSLRGTGMRGIGEAWMLAVLEMERGREPARSEVVRDKELRCRRWGRWRGLEGDVGAACDYNPLLDSESIFCCSSPLLFEPCERGGLGLPMRRALLAAGVAELRGLCSSPMRGSGDEGRWILEREAAKRRVGPQLFSALTWNAWSDTVQTAQECGIAPVRGSQWRSQLSYTPHRRSAGDAQCRERLLSAIRNFKAHKASVATAEVWKARLLKGFAPRPEVEPLPQPADEAACGAIGWSVEEGAEDFISRGELDPQVFPAAWRGDWRERAWKLRKAVKFDQEGGWPCKPVAAPGSDEEFVCALPPALQLAVRARTALGPEAKWVARGWGRKLSGIRVALDVQWKMWETLCELQARLEFDYAFSVDASSGTRLDEQGRPVRDDWGWPVRRTAAAVVAHDGTTCGGVMDDELPANNYAGEMMALVEALRQIPGGKCVLIIFDATSPAKAWRKFRQLCRRRKRSYKEAPILEELDSQVRRQRLVYLLWQPSHCGAPVNEAADAEAERIRLDNDARVLEGASSSPLFDMWPSRPVGSLFAWARDALSSVAASRLGAGSEHVLRPEEDDWALGPWPEFESVLLRAMRRDTLMAGDLGHSDDRRAERAHVRVSCPLGCTVGGSLWHHYAFHCSHPDLRASRARWRLWIIHHRHQFDGIGLHPQVEAVLSLLRGDPATRQGGGCSRALAAARRLMAGLVERVALGPGYTQEAARSAVRTMVQGGTELLTLAIRLEAPLRRQVVAHILDNKAAYRALRRWAKKCKGISPLRYSILRQIRWWRLLAEKAVSIRVGEESLSRAEALSFLRHTWATLAKVKKESCLTTGTDDSEAGVLWFIKWRWWQTIAHWDRGERLSIPCSPLLKEVQNSVALLWPEAARIGWGWKRQTVYLRSTGPPGGHAIRVRVDVPGMIEIGAVAFRRWLQSGGGSLLRRIARRRVAAAKAVIRERQTVALAAAQAGLRNFMAGQACSGGPLPQFGESERVVVNILVRCKRAREEELWRQGLRADKRGRWAVADILSIQRPLVAGGDWEALVSWMGPFDPEWLSLRNLCGPARKEALEMKRALYSRPSKPSDKAKRSVEEACDPPVVRRSARLAARTLLPVVDGGGSGPGADGSSGGDCAGSCVLPTSSPP